MTLFGKRKKVLLTVVPLALALTAGTGLYADHHEGGSEPNSALSFSAGVDASTAYYYNGIPQQNKGVVTWPWTEMGIQFCEAIGVTFGTWNSLHDNGSSSNPWYESDFSAGTSISAPGLPVEFGVTYVYRYHPNGGDFFSEELQFSLRLDDSEIIGDAIGLENGLSPYVQISQEIDGGSDTLGDGTNPGHRGTLLLVGVEPGVTAMRESDYPVNLSLPVTLGLNLDDYYETSGPDDDEDFGFVDVGLVADFPLAFIPAEYGNWSAAAAFHVLFLGDSARQIGRDFGVASDFKDIEVYGTAGITVEM